MMRSSTVKALVATVAIAALAACGSDSPTATSPQLDLNSAISQMSAGSPSSYAGASAMLGAPLGTSAALVPSSCAYSASLQGFSCPARTVNGLTITGTFFLYDGSGVSLTAVDPTKAASLRTVTDVQGTTTMGNMFAGTMTMNQHADMTMSGLLTATRTLNGTSTAHMDSRMVMSAADTLHSIMDMSTLTRDLVLPAPGATNHYPKSGSITVNMTESGILGDATSFTSTMVMTFNGTSVVTITMTDDLGTSVCKLDMTGTGMPVCS